MSDLVPAKILAVDDEADFEVLLRQRFRHQIRAREFDFRFACHGEEALSKLADEPDIELLLLDINMPVMDGLTLLAELRTRQSPARARDPISVPAEHCPGSGPLAPDRPPVSSHFEPHASCPTTRRRAQARVQ